MVCNPRTCRVDVQCHLVRGPHVVSSNETYWHPYCYQQEVKETLTGFKGSRRVTPEDDDNGEKIDCSGPESGNIEMKPHPLYVPPKGSGDDEDEGAASAEAAGHVGEAKLDAIDSIEEDAKVADQYQVDTMPSTLLQQAEAEYKKEHQSDDDDVHT
eukprot:GFYU01002754.1.p1 GENE.GFYU01002754.1~~GFYU01002754.1.p1  ORF type:complete len:156 (+),score=37.05 GFYU01002754.1:58-525(+)